MAWTPDFALTLPSAGKRPLFERVGAALVDAIRAGRLRPGDRLPSTRGLAQKLGVHRNTAVAAYSELTAQGWIESARGRGTFVSGALPEGALRSFAPDQRARVPGRIGYALAPTPRRERAPVWPGPQRVLSLAGGVPDLREVPTDELARAYRRALRTRGRSPLDYGYERGHPALRAQVAAMLSALRGLAVSADEVFITRGSQLALYLTARALVRSGDAVAVESLGYAPAWEAFRAAGARLLPVPLDAHGLRVDRLAAIARRGELRAVYLTPHHQYPTLAVLSAERRLALLELARRHRFAVIEDDYDYEMYYEGRPLLPLASADTAGVVVYVGTLSKILAPGVRIGYAVAPAPVLDRFAALRRFIDREGDPSVERAVAELLEDGVIERHARRMRRVYRARRDALAEALRRELAAEVQFAVPSGGMALWVSTARGLDVDAWAARAMARGAHFATARAFAFDGRPRGAARLGYAHLREDELREAVRLLRAAL